MVCVSLFPLNCTNPLSIPQKILNASMKKYFEKPLKNVNHLRWDMTSLKKIYCTSKLNFDNHKGRMPLLYTSQT